MKRLYFLIFAAAVGINSAFSQAAATNCTQVLRLARNYYEQGRLHEMPSYMEGCLKATGDNGFTREEKREAYRLLTLAYIYLEEPEKADESMLALLNTDHFFQINEALDPAEFIALYNKFRHEPQFWVALKFGLNISQPTVTNYYNIGSTGAGAGTYSLKPSINIFLAFEKDVLKSIFPGKVNKNTSRIALAPEVGFVSRSYGYTNDKLAFADETPDKSISNQVFAISQSWIDLNVLIKLKLKDTQNTKTYVGVGPGVSYLLGSSNQASTVLGNGFTNTGGSIDETKSYNKLVYSVSVGAGAKLKFGDIYVMGDVRYQYGLSNVIDKTSRTNPDLGFNYQGQYNDYRVSNFVATIGVAYPYFKPKKLIK